MPLYIPIHQCRLKSLTKMASISSSAVATVNRTASAQASLASPFTGLKSNVAFPVTKKANDFSTLPSNGGRVQCMKVHLSNLTLEITEIKLISSFCFRKMNYRFGHHLDWRSSRPSRTFHHCPKLLWLRKSTTSSATNGFPVWNSNWRSISN